MAEIPDLSILDTKGLSEPRSLDEARRRILDLAARLEGSLRLKAELEARLAGAETRARLAAEDLDAERLRRKRLEGELGGELERARTELRELDGKLRSFSADNEALKRRRGEEDSRLHGESGYWRRRAEEERARSQREREDLEKELRLWRRKAEIHFERVAELERRVGAAEEKAERQAARLWERECEWDKERGELLGKSPSPEPPPK